MGRMIGQRLRLDDEDLLPLERLWGVDLHEPRPRVRAECRGGPRPCPYVSCRHHLAYEIDSDGEIVENFPGRGLEELLDTCALDVADRGAEGGSGLSLQQVGDRLNVTRERVRQIELAAIHRLHDTLAEDAEGVTDLLPIPPPDWPSA